MPIEGVDYSSSRPGLACLVQSGTRFAVRYTSVGAHAKNITAAEAKALTLAGMRVVTVFEESAGRMLLGSAQGAADAKTSWAMGKAAGMHSRAPHFFALDVNPNSFTDAQWSACAAYLDGAASVLGRSRVGLYGNDLAMDRLRSHAPWLWQTYAWSGDPTHWASGVELQQYKNGVSLCGGTVDLDRALVPSYGQWGWHVYDGVDLKRAQDFARSCDPIPYRMTLEVSRDGIDCSGFMSVLINSLMGKPNVWVRLFATGTIQDLVASGALPMLRTGKGDANDFNIGVLFPWESSSGIGHTAGTLGGLKVESRGGDGVVIGSDARGYDNPLFKHHYHIKVDNIVTVQEDDMTPLEHGWLEDIYRTWRVRDPADTADEVGISNNAETGQRIYDRVKRTDAAVATLQTQPPVPVTVDAAAVAEALASNQTFLGAVAKAVADENARRQAE